MPGHQDFNFIDWKKYPRLVGTYTGQYSKVGKFRRNAFVFSTDAGTFCSWDYFQLKRLLNGVPFGTRMEINCLGLKPMPDKPTNNFLDFTIEVLASPKVATRGKKR